MEDEYLGYRVIADQYLHYKCYYYDVMLGDKLVMSTLWYDDKHWDSLEDAIRDGKKEVDRIEAGECSYFVTKSALNIFN